MKLDEVLKLRKAKKYIKRTGSPGHYKYLYKEKGGFSKTKTADMQVEGRTIRTGKKKKLKEALVERQEKKPASSKEYMKEHAVGIRKEADELKRMGKKDFRKRLEEKYKGETGRKQLIKDLVKKLKREAPKHSFSEIEEGAFSTKDMLDMFIGD